MEKGTFYTAHKARKDFDLMISKKENYVNDKKMAEILDLIEHQINSLPIGSESSFSSYDHYAYHGFLSRGEINFLVGLGYKVTWEESTSMVGDYYKIKW